MADREKVIKELSWLIYNFPFQKNPKDEADRMCNTINMYCNDALALLKEQESRVMTPKEFDEVRLSKPVWLEVGNMGLLEPALFRYLRPEYGRVAFSLIENRAIERDVTEYNWGWRCWTSRPSPEQMRDTPWEVEDARSSENNTPS